MIKIKNQNNIPLVVIGNGKKDKEDVKQLMAKNGLRDKLILLNELPASKDSNFTTAKDFPAIYQQALALIYPSIFEGFGAPLLEALYSGIPVISSNASCLPEVGGDAAIYFDPYDINAIADHLIRISTDPQLRKVMIEKGLDQAKKFTQEQYAKDILNVYNKIL
jgi:glycosyltransferase involved in cell wall biosynthesis